MPDKKNQLAFLSGPLVMVGEGARPWLGELVGDLDDPEGWVNRLDGWFQPVHGEKLSFTARDGAGRMVSFKPYHQVSAVEWFPAREDIEAKVAYRCQVEHSTDNESGQPYWHST